MPDRSVTMVFRATVSDYVAKTRKMATETSAFTGELSKAAKAGKLEEVSRGAALVGGTMVAAFGAAVKSAADFEQGMSKVSAATHASSQGMATLREAALQAGADTAFSATEAAQAEEELAKAGVSVTNIVHGGLAGALNLAAAGELSVGEAAETAATAMTQFGLSGTQIPHVADLLAAGAGKAQGDVHDMAEALKQSGLVASQFGVSIEETTGTLSAFAAAGLIGSDAGTSFKQMLLQLANPSDKAAALMQKLGISAYDAGGKFVGVSGLAGQLQDKLGGLTDAQRQSALATIFGSDAIRAATVLYNDGASGITGWTKKVNDAGYASDTAARKMDNLSGDLEKLRGSLETAFIKAGSGANDVLRAFAQTADSAVDGVNKLPPAVSGTATVLVGLVGLVLGGAGAFGAIAPKIRTARDELEAIGPAGKKASAALGAIGKAGAIGAVAAVGLGVVATAANAIESAVTTARPSVGDLARSLQKLGATGKTTGAALRLIGTSGTKLANDIDILNASGLDGLSNKIDQWKLSALHAIGINSDLGNSYSAASKDIGRIDEALASMVTSGYADQAQVALVSMASQAGVSVEELRKRFPKMDAALKQMAEQAGRTGGPMDDLSDSFDGNALEAQAAADAVSNYGEELDNLNTPTLDARDAAIDFRGSLRDLKDSLDANGGSFKGTTEAADKNNSALDQSVRKALAVYHAMETLYPGTDKAAASIDGMRKSLINTLTPYFDSKEAAKKFVDTVLKIPKKKATDVSAPGAKGAKGSVDNLLDSLSKLPKHKTIIIDQIINSYKGKGRGPAESNGPNDLPGLIGGDRWGGIRHFDVGGIYQGTPNGLYRFAEQSTGDEALVPRLGDAARSRSILDVAAGWYGGTISWSGSGQASSSASAPAPNFDVRVFIGDQELTGIVRTEIRETTRRLGRGARTGAGSR